MKSARNNNAPRNTEDTELHDVFMKFHQKFVACLRKEAENLQLSISQLEIMRFVVIKNNPTMKDIAVHLNISAPSTTSLVEHLYNKKLVKRETDPLDRRGVRISSTKKLLKLFSSFKDIKSGVVNEMLRPLASEDRKRLTEILKKLI